MALRTGCTGLHGSAYPTGIDWPASLELTEEDRSSDVVIRARHPERLFQAFNLRIANVGTVQMAAKVRMSTTV
jgi:hypothetical protein